MQKPAGEDRTFSLPARVAHDIEAQRAYLRAVMHELECELVEYRRRMEHRGTPAEFSAAVRNAAEKLARAALDWDAMAAAVRREWGLP
jgi:hypothetical protein